MQFPTQGKRMVPIFFSAYFERLKLPIQFNPMVSKKKQIFIFSKLINNPKNVPNVSYASSQAAMGEPLNSALENAIIFRNRTEQGGAPRYPKKTIDAWCFLGSDSQGMSICSKP